MNMSVIEYDLIPNNGVLLNIGSSYADYGNFPSFLFVCCRIQMEKLFNIFLFFFSVRKTENFAETQKSCVPTIYQITFITSFFCSLCCLSVHTSFMYHFTPHNSLAKSNKLSSKCIFAVVVPFVYYTL